jgi:hypothetical protein
MQLVKLNKVAIPNLPSNEEPYASRPIPAQGIPLHHLCACIGGTGSGKTTAMLKFFLWYDKAKTFDRIIIFSPTLSREAKGRKFLEDDHYFDVTYYPQYSDAVMKVERQSMIDDIAEWGRYQKHKEAYEKFKHCKCIDDLTFDELCLLQSTDFEKPTWKYKQEQYPCFALMIDDHVGKAGVFGANCKGFLSELCVEHRHCSLSIYLLSQVFKNFVPRQFRGGIINLWILFSTKSQEHKEEIAQQVANKVDKETFVKLWDFATKDDSHDALVIDYKAPDVKYMFRRNFDRLIELPECD